MTIPKIDLAPVTRLVGAIGFKVVKHSPTILLTAGVGLIGAGVYFACKKTLSPELPKATKQLEYGLDCANDPNAPESYTKSMRAMDSIREIMMFLVKIGKIYWLPAILLGSGVGCILWSHAILTHRLAATTAALLAMTQAWEAERHANYTERVDDDGKHYVEKSLDPTRSLTDAKGRILPTPYSVYADEDNCKRWSPNDPRITSDAFKAAERKLNNLLRTQGHVFLNEAFDELGLPRTDIGAVVGWVYYGKDSVISFVPIWMYDDMGPEMQDWVHGRQRLGEPGMDEILLSFNCQGPILGIQGHPDEEYLARRRCLDDATERYENPVRVLELDYDMENPDEAAAYAATLEEEMAMAS